MDIDSECKIRHEIRAVVHELVHNRTQLTYAEYIKVRDTHGLNSYEREALFPYMDNNCLGTYLEQSIIPNTHWYTSRPRLPATTYDDLLVNVLSPIIIERLKNNGNQI